ncbi:hypothetical protein CDO73_16895 [Saccharibacillus sp. O23]|nr:hypothetical protein CDO73_16895 [Saccharibacillus sp. O23]
MVWRFQGIQVPLEKLFLRLQEAMVLGVGSFCRLTRFWKSARAVSLKGKPLFFQFLHLIFASEFLFPLFVFDFCFSVLTLPAAQSKLLET